MAKIFFDIKRRDYPALGASPARGMISTLGYPSRFSLPSPFEIEMPSNPAFKDVPNLPEKKKSLNSLIKSGRKTIAVWESSEPNYPLLPKVKEQLARNEKLLKEVTGGQPCQ